MEYGCGLIIFPFLRQLLQTIEEKNGKCEMEDNYFVSPLNLLNKTPLILLLSLLSSCSLLSSPYLMATLVEIIHLISFVENPVKLCNLSLCTAFAPPTLPCHSIGIRIPWTCPAYALHSM